MGEEFGLLLHLMLCFSCKRAAAGCCVMTCVAFLRTVFSSCACSESSFPPHLCVLSKRKH